MLLRANSELNEKDTNLLAVTEGTEVESGVPQGMLLSKLVELTLSGEEPAAQAQVRQDLCEQLSPAGLVDAAAVIGNFQRMVRIADGTGIPLDRPVSVVSAKLRNEIGINNFESADRTPKVGALLGWIGDKLRPFVIKRIAKSHKSVS
ncbi:MAG: hypothetical protein ACI9ON_003860 [Limisphaerales bacterium]|jgi:hypothetical protein